MRILSPNFFANISTTKVKSKTKIHSSNYKTTHLASPFWFIQYRPAHSRVVDKIKQVLFPTSTVSTLFLRLLYIYIHGFTVQSTGGKSFRDARKLAASIIHLTSLRKFESQISARRNRERGWASIGAVRRFLGIIMFELVFYMLVFLILDYADACVIYCNEKQLIE